MLNASKKFSLVACLTVTLALSTVTPGLANVVSVQRYACIVPGEAQNAVNSRFVLIPGANGFGPGNLFVAAQLPGYSTGFRGAGYVATIKNALPPKEATGFRSIELNYISNGRSDNNAIMALYFQLPDGRVRSTSFRLPEPPPARFGQQLVFKITPENFRRDRELVRQCNLVKVITILETTLEEPDTFLQFGDIKVTTAVDSYNAGLVRISPVPCTEEFLQELQDRVSKPSDLR